MSRPIQILGSIQQKDRQLKSSFWTEEAGGLSTEPRRLHGSHFDHVIVGGGFVGLWTAIQIKHRQPNAMVAILERFRCGAGASGRNGGFVMSWWPKISTLLSIADKADAVRLAVASEEAIGEIGQFCERHAIDAHYTRQGWLWTATTESQNGAWDSLLSNCARLGQKPFEVVSAEEISTRTGSRVHQQGVLERSNATVQPARLALGLRRVAIAMGVEVFEETAVTHIDRGEPATVHTRYGSIRARSVTLATNAWSIGIPELASMIVPVNSSIVVTEPIPDKLARSGWTGGEAITDSQLMVNYYRTTRDGRIAFGKGTGALSWGTSIGGVFDSDAQCLTMTEAEFRRTYPDLGDVRITHRWCGPIDRTYDSLPVLGTLSDTDNVHYGIGWSGNGVGPSYLGGKILASLALKNRDEWSLAPVVGRKPRQFPPDPIRTVGGNIVRNAVIRKERAELSGQTPSWIDSSLVRLAPASLEDKG